MASDSYWILECTFDAIAASVRILLTADPDSGTIEREIIVPEIVRFLTERYHDVDQTCLGDFHGITIARHGPSWRYVLDTGDAKITFDSLQKVEV